METNRSTPSLSGINWKINAAESGKESGKKLFSIVLPIYGNEKNLPITIPYIIEHLDLFPDYRVEIIMVCDGSPDNSYAVMKEFQKKYPHLIKIARFARNCGQRAAVNCGMKLAKGDVIGVISADMQDPFELFVDMLKSWEAGELLVIARRDKRFDKGVGAKISQLLHRYINKHINKSYPEGGFDFFVIDAGLKEGFIEADTRNNSMQLLLLDIAGSAKQIGYQRSERKVGKSGWNMSRKIDQALTIFIVYSDGLFYALCKFAAFLGVIGLLVFVSALVQMGLGSVYTAIFTEVAAFGLLGLAAVAAAAGMLGAYGFKWMQNEVRRPRYIIAEMVDETQN